MGKAGSQTVGASGGGSARGEPLSPKGGSSNASKTAAAGPPAAAAAASGGAAAGGAAAPAAKISEEAIMKFHSAVRWAKPWPEIEEVAKALAIDLNILVAQKDPKNGNTVVHIAAQNGHLDLVKQLLAVGGPVNEQNGKGQTALHMTVEYDFYFVSKLLLEAGANGEITNEDGNKAILGIDGGKSGSGAWDNAVTILRSATTEEELNVAFEALEKAQKSQDTDTPEVIAKDQLIQVGLAKKKSPATAAIWDHKRFMKLAAQF